MPHHLPHVIPAGTWTLHLTFAEPFERQTPRILSQQLQGRPRRRPFPGRHTVWGHGCATGFFRWDERQFKAVFAVTLVIDPSLTRFRIPASSRIGEHGKRVVRFAESIRCPPIWSHSSSDSWCQRLPIMAGQTLVRPWVRAGQTTPDRLWTARSPFSLISSPSITTVPIQATNSI